LKDDVVDVAQRPLGKAFRRQIIGIVLSFRDSPEIKRLYVEQAARENRVLNIDPDSSDEAPDIQWKSMVMEISPQVPGIITAHRHWVVCSAPERDFFFYR